MGSITLLAIWFSLVNRKSPHGSQRSSTSPQGAALTNDLRAPQLAYRITESPLLLPCHCVADLPCNNCQSGRDFNVSNGASDTGGNIHKNIVSVSSASTTPPFDLSTSTATSISILCNVDHSLNCAGIGSTGEPSASP